jgi:hypothetical protein
MVLSGADARGAMSSALRGFFEGQTTV